MTKNYEEILYVQDALGHCLWLRRFDTPIPPPAYMVVAERAFGVNGHSIRLDIKALEEFLEAGRTRKPYSYQDELGHWMYLAPTGTPKASTAVVNVAGVLVHLDKKDWARAGMRVAREIKRWRQ